MLWPRNSRISRVPATGNRGSPWCLLADRDTSRKKDSGARILRSASSASSKARSRARSDSSPSALACSRQAMRRTRNCLWFDRDSWPKTSRYFSFNFPTLSPVNAFIWYRTVPFRYLSVPLIPLSVPSLRPFGECSETHACLVQNTSMDALCGLECKWAVGVFPVSRFPRKWAVGEGPRRAKSM